jgi:hypothetical protein
MKVYGQLETAQFETFTNAGKPAASSYAYRVIWISDLSQLFVSDGATWLSFIPTASSRLSSMYDIVIGSAAQVTSGVATHSTWASAISAASATNNVFVLAGTWAETVSISKQLNITGVGYGSYVNGAITFTSAADRSMLRGIRTSESVTLDSGADEILATDIWFATGKTFVDNGEGNFCQGFVAT